MFSISFIYLVVIKKNKLENGRSKMNIDDRQLIHLKI